MNTGPTNSSASTNSNTSNPTYQPARAQCGFPISGNGIPSLNHVVPTTSTITLTPPVAHTNMQYNRMVPSTASRSPYQNYLANPFPSSTNTAPATTIGTTLANPFSSTTSSPALSTNFFMAPPRPAKITFPNQIPSSTTLPTGTQPSFSTNPLYRLPSVPGNLNYPSTTINSSSTSNMVSVINSVATSNSYHTNTMANYGTPNINQISTNMFPVTQNNQAPNFFATQTTTGNSISTSTATVSKPSTAKRSSKTSASAGTSGISPSTTKVPKLRITRASSASQAYKVVNPPSTSATSTAVGSSGAQPSAARPKQTARRGRPKKQVPSSTTTSNTNLNQTPTSTTHYFQTQPASSLNSYGQAIVNQYQNSLGLNLTNPMTTYQQSGSFYSPTAQQNQSHPIFSLPLAQYPRYTTESSPPLPPRWEDFCKEALQASPLSTFHRVQLDPASSEYRVLSAMIQPCPISVTSIEKVANRELWKKFLNHRKECLISKSRNLNFLSQLGVGDDELGAHASLNLNFQENDAIAKVEYTDNIVLLYHCTKTNVNVVLEQGLDERVGNGGLLGRGIYFTDDPNKAIGYDTTGQTLLIFAVFLGDCLGLDSAGIRTAGTFTREPLKQRTQQRNFRDTFFDSIVGRPNTANEFVIYNRYQCVPLYVITYARGSGTGTSSVLGLTRASLPPFAWTNGLPTPLWQPYPFFAQTVFKLIVLYDKRSSPSSSTVQNDVHLVESDDEQDQNMKIAINLSLLTDLGFSDDVKNIKLLKKHKFDVQNVISELLEENVSPTVATNSQPVPSSSRIGNASQPSSDLPKDIAEWILSLNVPQKALGSKASSSNEAMSRSPKAPEQEDCPICLEEFPVNCKKSWIKLASCTHRLCLACHKQMAKTGNTMSGITHTFLKCPLCQACSGVQIGSCPNGTMTETQILGPGLSESWIQIQYYVNDPQYNLNRVAFLPNTEDGKEALRLLRIAWDRRLTFSIGTSATSGQTNTLVWNIHHKTHRHGGPSCYGFPDPTYFLRLRQELKQFGVE